MLVASEHNVLLKNTLLKFINPFTVYQNTRPVSSACSTPFHTNRLASDLQSFTDYPRINWIEMHFPISKVNSAQNNEYE